MTLLLPREPQLLCLQPVSVLDDTPFLPRAVPHPAQTPSFCLAPQHPEFVFTQAVPFATTFVRRPLLPSKHWGALLPSATFIHLADVFGELGLSFGVPVQPPVEDSS